MIEFVPGVRVAVRAVILSDNRVLVQRKRYEDGTERLSLPGGAPHPGEPLTQALQRECEEEIGCLVDVAELLHVADYFKARSTEPPTSRHQVEVLFRCHVPATYVPCNGAKPDKHQVSVDWLALREASSQPFVPRRLAEQLSATLDSRPVYLGLID